MGSWIIDLILNAITKTLIEFISGLVDTFASLLNDVFIVSQQVVKGDFVDKITAYSLKLGISLLIFLSIAQLIKLYVLPEGDDPESDIVGFFIRVGKSAVLMSFSTVICTWIIEFSNFVAEDILTIISGKIETASAFKDGITKLSGLGFNVAIGTIILMLIALVCIFIISIQAGLRGVNLAVLQMTAPLFAVNYITTDKGLWNKWIQNMMSVALTYVVQVTLTTIALKFFASGFGDITAPIIGICWLIVAIQSPKLLKEFAYSTGIGRGLSRTSSSALQLVRYLK